MISTIYMVVAAIWITSLIFEINRLRRRVARLEANVFPLEDARR